MFSGWEAFYQVTGEGAATLTGLLFLTVTLSGRRDPDSAERGMKLFSTPTVAKFVAVILTSALALAPRPYQGWSATAIFTLGAAGAVHGVCNCVRLRRSSQVPHWSDHWFYGVVPSGAYLLLCLSGAAAALRAPSGPPAVAMSVLLLMVLAIRNAWDLITWLAPRRDLL